jgi:hypothetical protein
VVLAYGRKYTLIVVYGSFLVKTPCQYVFRTGNRRKQRVVVVIETGCTVLLHFRLYLCNLSMEGVVVYMETL